MEFDLTTLGGVLALTVLLVNIGKVSFPKLFADREALASLVIGELLAVVSHAAGMLAPDGGLKGWVTVIIGGLLAGGAAQVAHDKIVNPLIGKTSNPL